MELGKLLEQGKRLLLSLVLYLLLTGGALSVPKQGLLVCF